MDQETLERGLLSQDTIKHALSEDFSDALWGWAKPEILPEVNPSSENTQEVLSRAERYFVDPVSKFEIQGQCHNIEGLPDYQ